MYINFLISLHILSFFLTKNESHASATRRRCAYFILHRCVIEKCTREILTLTQQTVVLLISQACQRLGHVTNNLFIINIAQVWLLHTQMNAFNFSEFLLAVYLARTPMEFNTAVQRFDMGYALHKKCFFPFYVTNWQFARYGVILYQTERHETLLQFCAYN